MGPSPLIFASIALTTFLACSQGAGGLTDAGGPDVDAAVVDNAITGQRCEGDRRLASATDVDQIAGCVVIGGNLSVTGSQLVDVRLPWLEAVEGFLTVSGNPDLDFFAIPSLATIGGYLDVSSNDNLGILFLPELGSVNSRRLTAAQDVLFSNNPRIGCQDQAIATQLREKGFKGSIRIDPENPLCSE